jgi:hypothetical protein
VNLTSSGELKARQAIRHRSGSEAAKVVRRSRSDGEREDMQDSEVKRP